MWPSWGRSSPRIHSASSPDFRCTSFKDVQTLCSPDESFTSSPRHPCSVHPSLDQHRPRQPPSSTKKIFHRVRAASSLLRNWPTRSDHPPPQPQPQISISGAENRIVVYTTSLRVVRPTFLACQDVQSILSGFRVPIDERDLSMDSGFLDELEAIMGPAAGGKEKITLPRVFVGGRYVGGAEEVRQMHEIGELKKLLEGLSVVDSGICETCGGYRFVLCGECNGSHKVYSDKVGFRSCAACNQNGLVRCSSCNPTALVVR